MGIGTIQGPWRNPYPYMSFPEIGGLNFEPNAMVPIIIGKARIPDVWRPPYGCNSIASGLVSRGSTVITMVIIKQIPTSILILLTLE